LAILLFVGLIFLLKKFGNQFLMQLMIEGRIKNALLSMKMQEKK
jgi:flagellar biogenesis protein FliO